MWIKTNGSSQFQFQENGKFSIRIGQFSLEQNQIVVHFEDRRSILSWSLAEDSENHIVFSASENGNSWCAEFRFDNENKFVVLFRGNLREPANSLRIELINLAGLRPDHLLSQGISMGGCHAVPFPVEEEFSFDSYYQTMITKGTDTLQISFPLGAEHIAEVSGTVKGDSIVKGIAETKISGFGGCQIELSPLTLRVSSDPFTMMNTWADEQPRPDSIPEPVPGWNSWDYYRWTISEKEVLENAEFIASDPVLSKHVRRIIVDDGWQYCYGEWEANSFFPSGMESLARKLTGMGFEPGLWFAPAVVEPHSRIAQLNSDMLGQGDNGVPCLSFECMRRYGFVLDPTLEKTRHHLSLLFSRYAGMGYRHFKLDFLASVLTAPRLSDPSVPRGKIIETLLAPIRDATRGKSLLLGCNYPFNTGTGIVESVRVGGDIHAQWDGVCGNVTSVAARFWANKKLWLNDPDFALCRSFETANDPDLNRLLCCLVFNEPHEKRPGFGTMRLVDNHLPQAELLLSIVLMTGGAVNLSDKMTRLNEAGVELARKVVSAESGEAAVPLDLFRSKYPSFWIQKLSRGYRVLLVNWSDAPAIREMNLNDHGISASSARDFWHDGTTVAIRNNSLRAELPPRSCLLAVIS